MPQPAKAVVENRVAAPIAVTAVSVRENMIYPPFKCYIPSFSARVAPTQADSTFEGIRIYLSPHINLSLTLFFGS